MRKSQTTFLVLMTLMTFSPDSFGQSIDWGSFDSGITESNNPTSSGGSGGSTTIITDNNSTGVNVNQVATCGIKPEQQQSLPLTILKKLSNGKDFFKVEVDEKLNLAKVSSEMMIGNCNDMLEVRVSNKENPTVYYLGVFLKGNKTNRDFENCINEKVVTEGKVDPKKVVKDTLKVDFAFEKSGPLKYISEGPIGMNFPHEDNRGCEVYEAFNSSKPLLYTVNDREKQKRDSIVNSLCRTNRYKDISDETIEKYKEYGDILTKVRNELILSEVKKLASDIKASEDISGLDFSVIGDFQKYVIDPMLKEIELVYADYKTATGDQKKILEKKLKELKAKLSTFRKAPFLTEVEYNKLKDKGQFDAAEELFALRASIKEFEKVGFVEGSLLISPKLAMSRTQTAINQNKIVMQDERLKYQVRTGEVTGKSAQYQNISQQLTRNIQTRTTNYNNAINQLYADAQRKCNNYWVNRNKCLEKYATQIYALQTKLTKANERDTQLSTKFQQKSIEFASLEEIGRQYRTSQDSEGGVVTDTEDTDVVITDDININMPVDFSLPVIGDRGGNGGQQQYYSNQNQFQFQGGNNFNGNYDFRNPASQYQTYQAPGAGLNFYNGQQMGYNPSFGQFPQQPQYSGFNQMPYNQMYSQPSFNGGFQWNVGSPGMYNYYGN
jgi:hypothetical protein